MSRRTSESVRDKRRWLTDRIRAITHLEIPLRADIDNDPLVTPAHSAGRKKSGTRRATSEGGPSQTTSQTRTQSDKRGIGKQTATRSKPPKGLTVIPGNSSGNAGPSSLGVSHSLGQPSRPSISATLPGQNPQQPTHVFLGDEPPDPTFQNSLHFSAQYPTGPDITDPEFLTQLPPAFFVDIPQPVSYAPAAVPWNNSGKLPEPTTMQAPSIPDRLELWLFGGPEQEILLSTKLDPASPLTMVSADVLNSLGFDCESRDLHNGIFLIPDGPISTGGYTVTHYVKNLCILPGGDHDPIWFSAYVLPVPTYPQDGSSWTETQIQDFECAWYQTFYQDHVVMGSDLHRMLTDCPRQVIEATPGND
ncbi:hypothetical protein CC79DRAFT_1357687 [Sarocladium strictum]